MSRIAGRKAEGVRPDQHSRMSTGLRVDERSVTCAIGRFDRHLLLNDGLRRC